jgi:predicted ATPase
LLQAVSPLDEATLQRELAQLVDAEFLYQRGLLPQSQYLFKHALIQDAAYQSLLKSTRQQYHRQIAQVLEERFLETKETQPELLAHHYTEANLITQAIPYWQQAGQRASQRSANVEAISHFTKGLKLLLALPDTPERAQSELTLQLALGTPLMLIKGFTAPEVKAAYARARALCQQAGETPQLFSALSGLYRFYAARAEFQEARKLGEQLLTLAHTVQNPSFLVEAHVALGGALYWLGEFSLVRAHIEQAIALYDPQKHNSYSFSFGDDPRVILLSYAARVLWALGYPDQALQRSHEALTLVRGLSHPFSLAYALANAAIFHEFRREECMTQERAEATITVSSEQGFAVYLAWGTIMRGWALVEQGQGEEGTTQIRQSLTAHRTMEQIVQQPYFLALLAEAYGKVGRAEEGLTALAEALAIANKNGERWWEAELYRLKGELSLQSGVRSPESAITNSQPFARRVGIAHQNVSETETVGGAHPTREAEACFLKAIEIARRQQAKSLELRAVMSLSRLWQSQGKKEEARQMLAEIYGWFTEGFDTKDLQEAKALLKELQ